MRQRVWDSALSRETPIAFDHREKAKARQLPTEDGCDEVAVIPADAHAHQGVGSCAHAQNDHSDTGPVANTCYTDETEEAGLVTAFVRRTGRFANRMGQ
jgi:hypothetical protein